MWLKNLFDNMTGEQWMGVIGLVLLFWLAVWFLFKIRRGK